MWFHNRFATPPSPVGSLSFCLGDVDSIFTQQEDPEIAFSQGSVGDSSLAIMDLFGGETQIVPADPSETQVDDYEDGYESSEVVTDERASDRTNKLYHPICGPEEIGKSMWHTFDDPQGLFASLLEHCINSARMH